MNKFENHSIVCLALSVISADTRSH